MTTTMEASSNYWTAMALSATNQTTARQVRKYTQDYFGVKCFVTADAPNDMIPCEPFCNNCGFPTSSTQTMVCSDTFHTRCKRHERGRWFNEEQNTWNDDDDDDDDDTATE